MTPDIHVTRVTDGSVYGHDTKYCDPQGCAAGADGYCDSLSWRVVPGVELSSLDLRAERDEAVARGEEVEVVRWTQGGNTCETLYLPAQGRAGVCTGGDSDWTDASSAADAIVRLLTDRMVS